MGATCSSPMDDSRSRRRLHAHKPSRMARKPSTGSLSLASPTSTGSTLRRAGSNCTTVSEFNMTSELMSISDSAHSRGFARSGSANDATFQRKGSTTLNAPQGVVHTESCPAVASADTFAAPDADNKDVDNKDAATTDTAAVDEAKPAGAPSWPVKLPPARRHSSGYSPLTDEEVSAATAEAAAVMATAIAEAEAAAAADAADEEATTAASSSSSSSSAAAAADEEEEAEAASEPASPEQKRIVGGEVHCELLTELVEADDELIDEVMTPIHAHGRHGSVMSLSMSLDYDDDLVALSGSEVRFTLPSLAEPVAPPVIDDLEKHPCARRKVSPLLKSLDELRSSGELQLEIPLITLED
eukprot:Rhum_TRINITY_DN14709_c14_g1::Rhum_TRINITY_DN14709_c14_g1_i1::g.110769::m.110769